MGIEGQHVVVIGGTSGIGLGAARVAAEAGARVTVASSSAAKVEAAAADLPAGVRGRVVDIRDEASLAALFDEPLDHLVLSPGDALRGGPVASLDLADAKAGLEVRFWGVIAAIKHALPQLAERGSISLTTGTVSVRPFPGGGISSGLAASIDGLARGLAVELAPRRVNAISFGFVETPMLDGFPEQLKSAAEAKQLVGRFGTVEEAGRAYLYLMENDYVTGTVLGVDGGAVLV
jgi:NAD(P)-dependent dehydrogenase (short-subunit alcohol dehydrogenase family)